jgi:hypothetical protein
MGFWPAAQVLSALFALVHAGNRGESEAGLLMILAFGLLHCLFLRRACNLADHPDSTADMTGQGPFSTACPTVVMRRITIC